MNKKYLKITSIIILIILSMGIIASFVSKLADNKLAKNSENDYRYVIEVNGKYGFINKKGEEVIKPQYDYVGEFVEGLAPVKINMNWGYIDNVGKIIIPVQYAHANTFSEGLALVLKNNKWGYIDKTGKYIIKPIFEIDPFEQYAFYEDISKTYSPFESRTFNEGLASANRNGLWGYINKKGRFTIKPQFAYVNSFLSELTVVQVDNADKSGCYAINKFGKIILDYQKRGYYNGLEGSCPVSFSEDMLPVYSDINKSYGYIDKTGQKFIRTFVKQPQSDEYFPVPNFSEGLAVIEKRNKKGYINKLGEIVIKPQYEDAGKFSEGLAGVLIKNKWGFIDKTGKLIIKPRFYKNFDGNIFEDMQFKNGLAKVIEENKHGYINKNGDFVWFYEIKKANSNNEKKQEKNKLSFENTNIEDLNTYLSNIVKLVDNKWQPPQSDENYEINLTFNIDKSGYPVNIKINNSSEDKNANKAALNAISSAAPFMPYPKEFKINQDKISFTLKYNAKVKGNN